VFGYSSGGVELSAFGGKIKVVNTLESRLDMMMRQVNSNNNEVVMALPPLYTIILFTITLICYLIVTIISLYTLWEIKNLNMKEL